MMIHKQPKGVDRNCGNCKFTGDHDQTTIPLCLHPNIGEFGAWTELDNLCMHHKYDTDKKAKPTRSIRQVRKL